MSVGTHVIHPTTDQPGNRTVPAGKLGVNGPGLALLGILVITATIGFENPLPALSIGVTLQLQDVLLLGSLGWIAVQWLFVPGFRLVRTPLDLPMLTFSAVTLFSTLMSIVRASVDIDLAIEGIRIFSYYLTFFVVTNSVKQRTQLIFLLNGTFLLATLVAMAIIVQYVLGDSVKLVQGSVDPLNKAFGTVTRIVPPGHSILLVAFVTSLCILVVERFKPMGLLRYLQCGLMGIAFLMTFLRSYWAASIVVLFFAASLLKGVDRRRLIGWGVVAMIPAVLALLVVFAAPNLGLSKLVEASWARLSTVNRRAFTGGDSNYNYRRLENEYAFGAIAARPVIGGGIGAAYRPLDPRLDGIDGNRIEDRTTFIHNGHLKVLLQAGLLGYLSLMWLSVAFLLRGYRNWRRVPDDRMRAVMLGFTLVYLIVLLAAGANSIFMQWSWISVLGIMMGVNEVIVRQGQGDVVR